MKWRIALAAAALATLAACRGTGNDYNNSEGISGLSANNSAFRGGAAPPAPGNAVTNSGTGVTGGNGAVTATGTGASRGAGRNAGGSTNNENPPSAPGTR